jgi:hypothetical protein
VPRLFAAGFIWAMTSAFFTLALSFALTFRIFHPFLRLLATLRAPTPRAQMLRGSWKKVVIGKTQEDPGIPPRAVIGILGDAGRDPAHWSSARIALEAGLALALQEDDLRKEGLRRGGVLTPASGLGLVLVERLRRSGFAAIVREHHGTGDA